MCVQRFWCFIGRWNTVHRFLPRRLFGVFRIFLIPIIQTIQKNQNDGLQAVWDVLCVVICFLLYSNSFCAMIYRSIGIGVKQRTLQLLDIGGGGLEDIAEALDVFAKSIDRLQGNSELFVGVQRPALLQRHNRLLSVDMVEGLKALVAETPMSINSTSRSRCMGFFWLSPVVPPTFSRTMNVRASPPMGICSLGCSQRNYIVWRVFR